MTGDKEEVFLDLSDVTARQRAYFRSGATLPLPARRRALESLLQGLTDQEGALLAALEADLGKPSFEGYMTELGLVREELRFHLKHLGRWTRPRRVPTPLAHFPARSTVRPEPYGSVLILSPWNYPIQLSLMPLIGALSAGNCAVLKPSAYAPACSRALAELVARSLPPELAAEVTEMAKSHAGNVPVMVKLSPNVTDITEIARAVEAAGADAVSLINTIRGMRIDVNTRRPILKMNTGGLSGPAVLPVAVRMVWEVSQAVKVPVLGMGGVSKGEDAAQLMLAGASAVAVGTALFADPFAPIKVRDGLEAIAARQGLEAVSGLTGGVCPW